MGLGCCWVNVWVLFDVGFLGFDAFCLPRTYLGAFLINVIKKVKGKL